jgi:hypothetical protein
VLDVRADFLAPWLTCPACLARIQNPAAKTSTGAIPEANVDREVRHDMKGAGWAFIVVSVLACAGLGFTVYAAIESASEGGGWRGGHGENILILTSMVSGALLVTTIYMGRILINPDLKPEMLGTFRLAGVAGIGCFTIAAAIIFFFLGCSAAFLKDLSGIGR